MFENDELSSKLKLAIYSFVVLNLLNFILLVYFLNAGFNKSVFAQDQTYFSFRPSINSFCYQAFLSLLNKEPSSLIFDETIVQELQNSDYSQLELVGEEKIQWIKVDAEKLICRFIVKDLKGIRYWRVNLEESQKFPAIFKVVGVHENDPSDSQKEWK